MRAANPERGAYLSRVMTLLLFAPKSYPTQDIPVGPSKKVARLPSTAAALVVAALLPHEQFVPFSVPVSFLANERLATDEFAHSPLLLIADTT